MIYFIRCGEFVKIGRALNPETRVKDLQVGNPYEVELLGAFDGDDAEEGRLHAAFGQYHHRAEWFFLSQSIRAFVTKVCSAKPMTAPNRPIVAPNRPRLITLETWKIECTSPCPGESIQASDAYRNYTGWCQVTSAAPLVGKSFFIAMRDDPAVKRVRRGGRFHYTGIALKRQPALQVVSG
jgi:hypothetical protein